MEVMVAVIISSLISPPCQICPSLSNQDSLEPSTPKGGKPEGWGERGRSMQMQMHNGQAQSCERAPL